MSKEERKDGDLLFQQVVSFLEQKKEEMINLSNIINQDYEEKQQELKKIVSQLKEMSTAISDLEKKDPSNKEVSFKLAEYYQRKEIIRNRWEEIDNEIYSLSREIKNLEDKQSQLNLSLNVLKGDYQNITQQIGKMPKLPAVGLQILTAVEEERKRIARDIHDGPAQGLANVVLRLELCEKLLEQDKDAGKKEIKELKPLVKNSLQEVRRLIFDLTPMTLDDLGIVPTIKRFLQNLQEHFPLNFDLVVLGEERRLNINYEINLFRIAQEAINNIVKHSQAQNVRMVIEISPSFVILSIKDDGKGFVLNEVLSKDKATKDKLGLISMRERAELLGGSLTIKSAPGEGTMIMVKIPLDYGEKGSKK